jgi:hypothetical protein
MDVLTQLSDFSLALARPVSGEALTPRNQKPPQLLHHNGTVWYESETTWAVMRDVAANMSGAAPWAHGTYWFYVESHTHAPGLAWSFDRLAQLKTQVEGSASGCRVVLTTVLREPESYFWSTYFWDSKTGYARIPSSSSAEQLQAFALSRVAADPNRLCRKLFWSPGHTNCDIFTSPQHPRCTDRVDGLPEVHSSACACVRVCVACVRTCVRTRVRTHARGMCAL